METTTTAQADYNQRRGAGAALNQAYLLSVQGILFIATIVRTPFGQHLQLLSLTPLLPSLKIGSQHRVSHLRRGGLLHGGPRILRVLHSPHARHQLHHLRAPSAVTDGEDPGTLGTSGEREVMK